MSIFDTYEVTIQLDCGKITVEVDVLKEFDESVLQFAAEAEIQKQLNYSKLDSYRKIKDGK